MCVCARERRTWMIMMMMAIVMAWRGGGGVVSLRCRASMPPPLSCFCAHKRRASVKSAMTANRPFDLFLRAKTPPFSVRNCRTAKILYYKNIYIYLFMYAAFTCSRPHSRIPRISLRAINRRILSIGPKSRETNLRGNSPSIIRVVLDEGSYGVLR